MRALLYLIIGAIITAGGIWWMTVAGHTLAGLLAGLVVAVGGALVVTGFATALDLFAPTSKRQ